MQHNKKRTDIILLTKLRNLGDVGDVVQVKPGFARNYLLPRALALRSNEANRKLFEARRGEIQRREARQRALAAARAAELEGLTLVIGAQASGSGQLYAPVSVRQIAQAAAERGFVLPHDKLEIERKIMWHGTYEVAVRLHADVEINIEVIVGHPNQDFNELFHKGASIEDRHHLAYALIDRLAIDMGRSGDDAARQLVQIVELADAKLGLRARDALRNQASGQFESAVRSALDELEVDCLFSLTADVDRKNDSYINFKARLCAAIPVRIGNSSTLRLADGHQAEQSRFELSLFSPDAEPVSDVQRKLYFAEDRTVAQVELAQSLRRDISWEAPLASTEVWAAAHLNGTCIHRRVWSIL